MTGDNTYTAAYVYMCKHMTYCPLQEFFEVFMVISMLGWYSAKQKLFLKLKSLLHRYTAAGLDTLLNVPETHELCTRYCALHPSVINSGKFYTSHLSELTFYLIAHLPMHGIIS